MLPRSRERHAAKFLQCLVSPRDVAWISAYQQTEFLLPPSHEERDLARKQHWPPVPAFKRGEITIQGKSFKQISPFCFRQKIFVWFVLLEFSMHFNQTLPGIVHSSRLRWIAWAIAQEKHPWVVAQERSSVISLCYLRKEEIFLALKYIYALLYRSGKWEEGYWDDLSTG